MALKIKDVIGLIITYIGTSKVGALPLKPTIGVNIGGTPAMSVDLFATLGGIFPNLSAAIQGALTSTFNGLITSLGLDPVSPFMSSPLGTAYKELTGIANSTIADLQLSANIGIDSVSREFDAAVSGWKSWVDTAVGIPPSMITGIAPENLVVSSAAQAMSPSALLGNMDVALTHAVAIEQGIIQPAFSTVLFDAAKADIALITSRIADATTQTARDLLGQELKNTLTQYTDSFNTQRIAAEATATEISNSINAPAIMAEKVAPPTTNMKLGNAARASQEFKNALPSARAALDNYIVQTQGIVLPVFKEKVLPAIEEAASMEANTSITATTLLEKANAANVVLDNTGNPVGVNVRYDSP